MPEAPRDALFAAASVPDPLTSPPQAAALAYHQGGKLAVRPRVPLAGRADLALAYTPGVAEVCLAIAADPACAARFTSRGNLVAVVTDGSAVLGLGDLGPAAALPVMEGKCLLLGRFGGVDAVPVCLACGRSGTADAALVDAVAALSPSFGGINLEDIAAPRCFAVERQLQERLTIPVFHDDQHGTAVVVAAALLGALRATGRAAAETRAVVNGAGAAGIRVAETLCELGIGDVILCDRAGALCPGRSEPMGPEKEAIAHRTNRLRVRGGLAEAARGADVLIGVSAAGAVSAEMVASMARRGIVLALANPDPEIAPELARAAGAAVIGTGRSDHPNQVNNALCFPGLFRGLLDAEARGVDIRVKLAAAQAIAALVADGDLERGIVVPDIFNPEVAPAVAGAVAEAAWLSGLARRRLSAAEERAAARRRIAERVAAEQSCSGRRSSYTDVESAEVPRTRPARAAQPQEVDDRA